MYRVALSAHGLLKGLVETLPPFEKLKAAVLESKPPPTLPTQQLSPIESWCPQVEKLLDKGLGLKVVLGASRVEDTPEGPEICAAYG